MSKNRRDRSDIQVGNLEKKHKVQSGTVRNTDQTDARSDKELGTLQREYGEQITDKMLELKGRSIKSDKTKTDD